MISISKHKLNDTIGLYKSDIDNHICDVRIKIKEWIENDCNNPESKFICLDFNQRRYLYFLHCQLDKIVIGDMGKLKRYKKIFDQIIPIKGPDFKPFKDKLISIMGYEKLRSFKEGNKIKPIYPQFFDDLGIKVCVYCNSQLTITTKKQNKEHVARFQVDHFIDKANNPSLSISFYNLYPVCSSCNNKKGGNKKIEFELYSGNSKNTYKSEFEFSIDRTSIAEFRLTRDETSLKINFDDKESGLNKYLGIQELYETQKDIAAEIIVKSEIYNDSYKKALQKSFSKLYGKDELTINFNRIILGTYTEPKDIHKRPMSKFTQDIAKQLKLI